MSLISDRAKAMLGKLAFNDADIEMMELADAANAGAATMKNEPFDPARHGPLLKGPVEDAVYSMTSVYETVVDTAAEYGFAADDNAHSYAFDVAQRYKEKLEREERWGRKQPTAAKTALSDDSDPAHIEVSDDDKAMWPWEIDEIEEVKQLTADPAVASLNVWGQNRRSIEVVTPSKTAAADETELIARWESAGGRWWVSLFRSGDAVYYRAVDAGGSLGNVSDEEAIATIEARLDDFQADANVTPMRRVALNPQSGHGESDLETPEIPNEHDPTPMWEWEIDELESEARLDKGVDDDLFL